MSGATIRVLLGRKTNGFSSRNDSVAGRTDASRRYSIDVPIGHAHVWEFDFPPGYWSEKKGEINQVVTSALAPVATKDFSVRRGPVVRVRRGIRPLLSPFPASSASRHVWTSDPS